MPTTKDRPDGGLAALGVSASPTVQDLMPRLFHRVRGRPRVSLYRAQCAYDAKGRDHRSDWWYGALLAVIAESWRRKVAVVEAAARERLRSRAKPQRYDRREWFARAHAQIMHALAAEPITPANRAYLEQLRTALVEMPLPSDLRAASARDSRLAETLGELAARIGGGQNRKREMMEGAFCIGCIASSGPALTPSDLAVLAASAGLDSSEGWSLADRSAYWRKVMTSTLPEAEEVIAAYLPALSVLCPPSTELAGK